MEQDTKKESCLKNLEFRGIEEEIVHILSYGCIPGDFPLSYREVVLSGEGALKALYLVSQRLNGDHRFFYVDGNNACMTVPHGDEPKKPILIIDILDLDDPPYALSQYMERRRDAVIIAIDKSGKYRSELGDYVAKVDPPLLAVQEQTPRLPTSLDEFVSLINRN